jgi:hypothetical protein
MTYSLELVIVCTKMIEPIVSPTQGTRVRISVQDHETVFGKSNQLDQDSSYVTSLDSADPLTNPMHGG